jgi:very-short-patch-repair endonuclease
VPRAKVPGAAIRAGLWAVSDRQAALVVTMTAQQKLASVEELASELLKVRRDRRRSLLSTLVLDLAGGVGSLGELDVVRGCRARGLPEPDVQVVRRTSRGTIYLDFRWREYGVALEVDGVQHGWVQNAVADALRHNSVAMEGDVVLRLPVLGLRLCPDEFFDQLTTALVSRGWRRAVV